VDNRIRIYSHAFLKLNENDFNGLDREILERNAGALIHFINYYKKEYRNTENEALTAFLTKKEYSLANLAGDKERIGELFILKVLGEVETCRSKEIAKSKVKQAIEFHANMNPGSKKNPFLHSFTMAQLYRKWLDKSNAIIHYKEAIKEFERLNLIKNKDGFLHYASLLYELGNLQDTSKLQLYYFEKALKYYKKSGDRQEIEDTENRVNRLKRIGGVK
jgi:hypothetical protein